MFVLPTANDDVEEGSEDVFDQAAERLLELATELDSVQLLRFYALFKQATVGPCNDPKPGIWDYRGRKKWQAWFDLGDMCRITARKEYVEKLREVDPTWDPKEHSKKGGVRVSKMAFTYSDDLLQADDCMPIFVAVKEGRNDLVASILHASPEHVHLKDANGMSLLHWAADRGHPSIISTLLAHSAVVNVRDNDGQTPLHYACCCGHITCSKLLVEAGADVNAVDHDGQNALELMEPQLRSELMVVLDQHSVVSA